MIRHGRLGSVRLLAIATLFSISSTRTERSPVEATNVGDHRPVEHTGHVLTTPTSGASLRVLYCPSEEDDAIFRSDIAVALGGDAQVDYLDTRVTTPPATTLLEYDCIFTWANFEYEDNIAFGDNLADAVDRKVIAVLGAFVAGEPGGAGGRGMAGRIMSEGYSPVTRHGNHFSLDSYAEDGQTCIHRDVDYYAATFRDVLELQGDSVADGSYTFDGEIATALRPDFRVIYLNGAGGRPIDGHSFDWPVMVANACTCAGTVGVPTERVSWTSIKALYR